MSDSDDYSYVEMCFNGAASVLPLPLCEMVLINSFVSKSMKFLFYSNYFLVVVVFPSVIWWALVPFCCWFEEEAVSFSGFLFLQGWTIFNLYKKEACKFMPSSCSLFDLLSWWCCIGNLCYILYKYLGFNVHGTCLWVLMLNFIASRLRTLMFQNKKIRMFFIPYSFIVYINTYYCSPEKTLQNSC